MVEVLNSIPGYLASKKSFDLMAQQEITGFGFHLQNAKSLAESIEQMMKDIEQEVEPQLPARPLKKSEQSEYTLPLKPFKKDGTISAVMQRFMDRHSLELIGINHIQWDGKLVQITGGLELPAEKPMSLSNQDDIKNWLMTDCGWVPTLFNYKKDARGKPVRDDRGNLIETSPKMQENGKLCPNLEEIQGDLAKQVVRWLSLRNRLSVLQTWIADPRAIEQGRLSAGSSGIAATHRQRHTKVVNVPKAEDGVILGKEFRGLFVPFPGHVQVGFDASALENRVEAHYCIKYPGGKEYAEEILNGDPHSKNAVVFYAGQNGFDFKLSPELKDNPRFKPFRSKAKNSRYCLSYGGSPKKLAKTLGLPESQGNELYEAFWENNLPLKILKDQLTRFWETTGEKKWIRGIDGRKLYSRSKHSLVNLLFQSCGAILMDYAGIYLDKWLGGIQVNPLDGTPGYLYRSQWVYRMNYNHDEYQLSSPPDLANEIGQIGVEAIEQAGRYLKMRVPMSGEYIVGTSWASTH